jgi:predicted molibdopterin-dependent oxidoreductase YjgC
MVLQAIARKLGAPWDYREPSDITADLLEAIPQYKAMDRGERVLWSERA